MDDNAAESHASLAAVYTYHEWDWKNAMQSLDRAIELNSSYAGAYLLKGILLCMFGKFDESVETMRKSIQLDPFFAPGHFAFAAVLTFSGCLKEASDVLDKLFEISPQFPDALSLKGFVCQLLGDYEKAEELFNMVQKIPGFEMSAYSYLCGLLITMNQPQKAKQYLEKLLEAEKTKPGQEIYYNLAYVYGYLNEPDKMFHYLNKSVESKEILVLYLLGQPSFKKYHSDPRFVELVKKIGFKR